MKLIGWSISQSFKVSPLLLIVEYIATAILSIFFIYYSKLQGELIDSFSRVQEGMWVVILPALMLLGFTAVRDILSYVNWSLIGTILRQKREKHFTQLFLHQYSSLDIGRIEQPDFQDLKNRVYDRALWRLQSVPNDVSQLIGRSIALVLGAGIIFAIHPLAAVSVVLGTIPAFILEIFYTRNQQKVWEDLTTERRAYWSMRDSFQTKRTIQELIISNKARAFLSKIDAYLTKEYRSDMKVEKKFVLPNILVKIVETLSIGGALYFIILQGYQGILSVGEIVFAFGVLYAINSSLAGVVKSISDLNANLPYLKDAREYLDTKPLVEAPKKPVPLAPNSEIKITFENVSFKYPEKEEYVLSEVSFAIASGEKLALVGLNGAGKSTLIKLLLRMYDPTAGRILINGIDLREIDLNTWYENLGVLLQDFEKYEFLSIRDSIQLFAKQHLEDDDIYDLLRKVSGESITDSETGLNLMQSSEYGGKELSGGQFQKIAIARTLSRNGNFVVLDEPTSAIDALSEEAVFENLNKLPGSVTLLFISHRFTTIRNANHILVLDGGKLAEEGTHQSLMKENHLYAQMYRSQVLGEK